MCAGGTREAVEDKGLLQGHTEIGELNASPMAPQLAPAEPALVSPMMSTA